MTGGEDEPVATRPVRIRRVVPHLLARRAGRRPARAPSRCRDDPAFAFCTASIASARIVSIVRRAGSAGTASRRTLVGRPRRAAEEQGRLRRCRGRTRDGRRCSPPRRSGGSAFVRRPCVGRCLTDRTAGDDATGRDRRLSERRCIVRRAPPPSITSPDGHVRRVGELDPDEFARGARSRRCRRPRRAERRRPLRPGASLGSLRARVALGACGALRAGRALQCRSVPRARGALRAGAGRRRPVGQRARGRACGPAGPCAPCGPAGPGVALGPLSAVRADRPLRARVALGALPARLLPAGPACTGQRPSILARTRLAPAGALRAGRAPVRPLVPGRALRARLDQDARRRPTGSRRPR